VIVLVAGIAPAETVKITNTYAAQSEDRWCAPASGQMILNSPTWSIGPAGTPTQLQLARRIRANNSAWNFYTTSDTALSSDPDGLKGALNHFDAINAYDVFQGANRATQNRQLVRQLRETGVPAAALINGGLHWVNVRGFESKNVAGNEVIEGFYVRDPWDNRGGTAGLGRNVFLADTAGGWRKSFNPVDAQWRGTWGGDYTFVAATVRNNNLIDLNWTPKSDLPRGPRIDTVTAAAIATTYISTTPGLFAEFSLSSGAFNSSVFSTLTWAGDSSDTEDYLLPLFSGSSITGAALVDAFSGEVEQVTWFSASDNISFSTLSTYYSELYAGIIPGNTNGLPTPGGVAALGLAGVIATRRRRPNA
jgi:MYXO-CTERM domain-containing protein